MLCYYLQYSSKNFTAIVKVLTLKVFLTKNLTELFLISNVSYILSPLLKPLSCFPDCRKVSFVVPVFKNDGERPMAKNYQLVSLLSMVSKIFEKLRFNRLVKHLKKFGLVSDFQYGFRFSRSTPNLLTVVSDSIAGTCNRSKAVDRV